MIYDYFDQNLKAHSSGCCVCMLYIDKVNLVFLCTPVQGCLFLVPGFSIQVFHALIKLYESNWYYFTQQNNSYTA